MTDIRGFRNEPRRSECIRDSRPLIIEYHAENGKNPPVIEGKFLHLTWKGHEQLVFAPAALHRYHNQILARFLATHAIDHRWLDETRLEFDHASLRVHGGGRYRVDAGHKTLRLYDGSQVYGRFDADRVARLLPATRHPWSAYTLTIS